MASEFHTKRRIEFSDTDMAGIVHFARFFVFMEAAEHEFLRSLDMSVSMEHDGNVISWPRLSTSCEYLHPVRFEDELDIHLKVERIGTKSITYQFEFSNGDAIVARGKLKAVCCICNPGEDMKATTIPNFITERMKGESA